MGKSATKINNFCLASEKRLGIYGAAFLFAVILMAVACLFTSSRWEVHFHGTAYSQLSMAPFDLSQENALRFRILSPLLGFLLFMRGPELYLYFMLYVMVVFMAGVYAYYRKKQYSGTESLGMVSLMAFSSVAAYIFYYPAYNDATSYLLILLCMAFYRETKVMALLLTLLLYNHENNLVLFPWLFYLMSLEEGRFRIRLKNVLPFLVAALLYAPYRLYITEHSKVLYTISYYFDPHNMEWTFNAVWKKMPVGIFQAFKLFWVFPLFALMYYFRKSKSHEVMAFALLFFGVLSQMIIVYDISRLICLAFPMILMGAETLRDQWGANRFANRLWLIVALNFLIPTYLIGALEPIYMKPLILQLAEEWFIR